MTRWYVRRKTETEDLGPLRPAELLKLVREGKVTPETMLRKDDSAYFAAGDVGGLFEAAMRPTIQYFCPQCNREVSEPPVMCPHCDFNVVRAKTRITENSITGTADASHDGHSGSSVKRWLNRKREAKHKER